MPDPSAEAWLTPSSVPALVAGEVHVWRAAVPAAGAEPARWRGALTEGDWARIERKRQEADRRRELTNRAVQRLLLAAYTGQVPHAVRFAAEQRGKPVLADVAPAQRIEFNSSHAGDWTVHAFAYAQPIGVDVERWREIERDDLVRQFFAADERAEWALLDSEGREAAFFAGWTRKEAYLKALGVGLMKPLDSFAVTLAPAGPAQVRWCADDPAAASRWRLTPLTVAERYAATVAHSATTTAVRRFTFPPAGW